MTGFGEWADHWARLGLWLSLWDDRPELIEHTGPGRAFWKALVQHSQRYRTRLRDIAGQCLGGTPVITDLDPSGGMLVIAVPIKHRHSTSGCMLACGLSDAFFDEETFARFCDNHRVDRAVFSRIATALPRHDRSQLDAYASVLTHHLEAFNVATLSRREINDLSCQLARTYEELNLLYRVGASMSFSKKPVRYCQELCEELLKTTVVAGFAVVVEPPRYLSTKPTVVRAGHLEATSEDLLRLYRRMCDRRPNAGQAIVVEDVSGDATLAWAADWLKRFVFYPLVRNKQHLGGILAINHVDDSDFDSYEIQFVTALAERSAAFLENVQLYDDLEGLFSSMLHALVSSIDAKDPYTCGHSQRVAWLSRYIAGLVGLDEPKCQRVYLSGLLHDIGKIGISESVLCKTGRLTAEEFQLMRQHPEIGARILRGVPQVADTLPGVLHHHERMDGKGYPTGLAGRDIPLLGRIIGLADAYDAMTTSRTYRKARPIQMAVAEIRRCAGNQFDPELADLFLRQDIPAIHRELTEFGNQSIKPHNESNLGVALRISM